MIFRRDVQSSEHRAQLTGQGYWIMWCKVQSKRYRATGTQFESEYMLSQLRPDVNDLQSLQHVVTHVGPMNSGVLWTKGCI